MKKTAFIKMVCRITLLVYLLVSGLPEIAKALDSMVGAKSGPGGQSRSSSEFFINLGDYAKGDGSDETEAIQRAIDAIPSTNDPKNKNTGSKKGGTLYVPRPKEFYGISKTLEFAEKWNITIECESPVLGSRTAPTPMYFKWIGEKGDQAMISLNTVLGARIINLSLDGRLAEADEKFYKNIPDAKDKNLDVAFEKPRAKGLIGVLIGPSKDMEPKMGSFPGIAKNILIQNLRIRGCDTGLWVGGYQKQSDTAHIRVTDAYISNCNSHGVVVNSTMAVVQFDNLLVQDSGISNVKLYGGDVGFSQYCGLSSYSDLDQAKKMVADIELTGGGIRVVGAWSETYAPFIKAAYGFHMYPGMSRVIIGAAHGCGLGGDVSIDYDLPGTLNLIGCGFRGDVVSGKHAGTIVAISTIFGNPIAGFRGEGITKNKRLVRIGTDALESSDPARVNPGGVTPRTTPRVAMKGTDPHWNDPYIIDRRNWPGTQPPVEGIWQKGDGVVNIDPDPNVPSKAWRGWICIKEGEPGAWKPYGAIGK